MCFWGRWCPNHSICPVCLPAPAKIFLLLFKQFWSSLVISFAANALCHFGIAQGISWFMIRAESSRALCWVSSTTLLCSFMTWTLLLPYICLHPKLFAVIFEIVQEETRYQENWKKAITLLDGKQNKEKSLAIVDSYHQSSEKF